MFTIFLSLFVLLLYFSFLFKQGWVALWRLVLLSWGFCVCVHLCLLRCSGFQLHLCLLDLGIGVWSVFVLILSKITVCLLRAHSVLLLIAVVRLPEPGKGTVRGRRHKQTELFGSPPACWRECARNALGDASGITDLFWRGTGIWIRTELWTHAVNRDLGHRCGEHLGCAPTALSSEPASALVPAEPATGNFQLHRSLGYWALYSGAGLLRQSKSALQRFSLADSCSKMRCRDR